MLYRHSEIFRTLVAAADLALVAVAWILANVLAAGAGPPFSAVELRPTLEALAVILPVWFVLHRSHGLYEAQRTRSLFQESGQVLRAAALGVVLVSTVGFFAAGHDYSRAAVALFAGLAPSFVLGMRLALRGVLRGLRRRGYNLRFVVVVGEGGLAEEVIERIRSHPWAGLRIRGVLAEGSGCPQGLSGVPVLGGYSALRELLGRPDERVDRVIIALSPERADSLDKILSDLDDQLVSVTVVPDLRDVIGQFGAVESLDGLLALELHATPLSGWPAVAKRGLDVLLSAAGLLLVSPLLLAIAVAIGLGSGRPIFFVQERMGLDGRVFRMFKFRSMVDGAESESGPVWAQAIDPRTTWLGERLRRFNLDELPQLWNVLRGDMSLVGPRPERPFFIESFRSEIPGYMQRHKVKSGLTGWAQVHGWRGRTSIHERLEHDLYYIRNWSFGLDVRILLMTLWRGLPGPNDP